MGTRQKHFDTTIHDNISLIQINKSGLSSFLMDIIFSG